jgi:hypothetical protein
VVDLVSEDEIKLPQTLPKGGIESVLSGEEVESESEIIRKMGRFVKDWGKWKGKLKAGRG